MLWGFMYLVFLPFHCRIRTVQKTAGVHDDGGAAPGARIPQNKPRGGRESRHTQPPAQKSQYRRWPSPFYVKCPARCCLPVVGLTCAHCPVPLQHWTRCAADAEPSIRSTSKAAASGKRSAAFTGGDWENTKVTLLSIFVEISIKHEHQLVYLQCFFCLLT